MDNLTDYTKKVKEGFVGQQMIVLPPDIKKTAIKNPLIKGLYLTAIGYYPKATAHDRERKNGCPQYILLYCTDGKGYINIGKEKYELTPNSYFIIPRGMAHHYGTSLSDPWSIYWVHFTGDYADLLYSRYSNETIRSMPLTNNNENQSVVRPIPYDEQRIELFNIIFSNLENSYNLRSVELTNIKLLQFLSSFIYHEEMFPFYYTADRASSSIKLMKENLSERYTIEELATKLGYSVSHYSDLFRKKTGSSPIQYFNQLKVRKSCQYLYFTDMNIKEICTKMGFDDPYYFSRLFKKLMGVSPAKYRNNYKK